MFNRQTFENKIWQIVLNKKVIMCHQTIKKAVQENNVIVWYHLYLLKKEMATHSSILAWKIPQTEEPGGLQSMGLQKNWT